MLEDFEYTIYEKFKKFLDSALFSITEVNDDYIVFNYGNYYDSDNQYVEQIESEAKFIKEKILPFIRQGLFFKGAIWIADSVFSNY